MPNASALGAEWTAGIGFAGAADGDLAGGAPASFGAFRRVLDASVAAEGDPRSTTMDPSFDPKETRGIAASDAQPPSARASFGPSGGRPSSGDAARSRPVDGGVGALTLAAPREDRDPAGPPGGITVPSPAPEDDSDGARAVTAAIDLHPRDAGRLAERLQRANDDAMTGPADGSRTAGCDADLGPSRAAPSRGSLAGAETTEKPLRTAEFARDDEGARSKDERRSGDGSTPAADSAALLSAAWQAPAPPPPSDLHTTPDDKAPGRALSETAGEAARLDRLISSHIEGDSTSPNGPGLATSGSAEHASFQEDRLGVAHPRQAAFHAARGGDAPNGQATSPAAFAFSGGHFPEIAAHGARAEAAATRMASRDADSAPRRGAQQDILQDLQRQTASAADDRARSMGGLHGTSPEQATSRAGRGDALGADAHGSSTARIPDFANDAGRDGSARAGDLSREGGRPDDRRNDARFAAIDAPANTSTGTNASARGATAKVDLSKNDAPPSVSPFSLRGGRGRVPGAALYNASSFGRAKPATDDQIRGTLDAVAGHESSEYSLAPPAVPNMNRPARKPSGTLPAVTLRRSLPPIGTVEEIESAFAEPTSGAAAASDPAYPSRWPDIRIVDQNAEPPSLRTPKDRVQATSATMRPPASTGAPASLRRSGSTSGVVSGSPAERLATSIAGRIAGPDGVDVPPSRWTAPSTAERQAAFAEQAPWTAAVMPSKVAPGSTSRLQGTPPGAADSPARFRGTPPGAADTTARLRGTPPGSAPRLPDLHALWNDAQSPARSKAAGEPPQDRLPTDLRAEDSRSRGQALSADGSTPQAARFEADQAFGTPLGPRGPSLRDAAPLRDSAPPAPSVHDATLRDATPYDATPPEGAALRDVGNAGARKNAADPAHGRPGQSKERAEGKAPSLFPREPLFTAASAKNDAFLGVREPVVRIAPAAEDAPISAASGWSPDTQREPPRSGEPITVPGAAPADAEDRAEEASPKARSRAQTANDAAAPDVAHRAAPHANEAFAGAPAPAETSVDRRPEPPAPAVTAHLLSHLEERLEGRRKQGIVAGRGAASALREARAEAQVPDFGRVSVEAVTRGEHVDLKVTAHEADAAQALREARPAMESHLRDNQVPLGHLSLGDRSAAGNPGSGTPQDRSTPQHDPSANEAQEPAHASSPARPRGRVRVVL